MVVRVLIGWLVVAVLLSRWMQPEWRVLCRSLAVLALLAGLFVVGVQAGHAARQRAERPRTAANWP